MPVTSNTDTCDWCDREAVTDIKIKDRYKVFACSRHMNQLNAVRYAATQTPLKRRMKR